MKLNFSRKSLGQYRKYPWVLLLVFFLSQCIFIDSVDQVSTIQSGEVLTSRVNLRLEPKRGVNTKLIIGFLAPKRWNAAKNAVVTYTSGIGNGTMSPVPPGTNPSGGTSDWATTIRTRVGIGANKLRDLEWVVYWSDAAYNVLNGQKITATVNVQIKTEEHDVICELGYFAACSTEPLSSTDASDVKFAKIETTDGLGPVTNFLVPQLSTIDPLSNTDNEYITVKLDGSIIENDLVNASDVYFCSTAYTNDHQEITVCGNDTKEKMTNIGQDQWQIDLWPRRYFGVSGAQKIDSIKYYFSNAAGDKTVKQFDTGLPFVRIFTCD